jgi:hypothetical protein
VAYAVQIEQAERRAMLAALSVDKDVRDALDEPYGVKSWPLPGSRPRPVKVRAPGVPEWWDSDEDASASFLTAMGVNLP